MTITASTDRRMLGERGFTLVELLVSTAITTLILGTTIAAMMNAVRANDTAVLVTSMNNNLRTAMDLVNRDLLQVGQGLPSTHVIEIPNAGGSTAVRRPGPPGTNLVWALGTSQIEAVTPGPALGPLVNGVPTDIITTLAIDGAFSLPGGGAVGITRITNNSVDIVATVNITNGGPDDLVAGDLLMVSKGTNTALVQVTSIAGQRVNFAAGDSLNLNQNDAGSNGTMTSIINTAPANTTATTNVTAVSVSRVLMITYYIDAATNPDRPRLVRRIGNGDPITFNNNSGTAVAFDVENFTVSYDLADSVNNPANIRFEGADLADGGTCGALACNPNNIRKVNVVLAGRSRRALTNTATFFRNTLSSQVSLRSLAFVDRYQ
jgi:prepilin-type N-terminal cleavage/methylation domain-containing protein